MIKFADDSTIQGLITENEQNYRDKVNGFTDWCDNHYLLLNIKKTKELIIDFRINKEPLAPLTIKNEKVEIVNSYKYLGVMIDDKLTWHQHASLVHTKMNQRLYFLRKLRCFNIDSTILSLFYKSIIESVLTFCITCWGGNCTSSDQLKFNRIIRKASKVSSHTFDDTHTLYNVLCFKKLQNILLNDCHPLFSAVEKSPRSGRVIFSKVRTERHRKSFLPWAVSLLLQSSTR